MKHCLPALFLSFAFAPLTLAEGIPTRGPEASPEYKKAIEQLNADAAAWNARCVVTRSEAEQSSCEQERASLEARKVALRNGVLPNSSAPNVSAYPTVDVTLRLSTRGKILKRVKTDSTGHFKLGTFPASVYIMEFRASKPAEVKNQRFAIQIDGIKAKGQQGGILAKYLVGGLGVDVETVAGTPVKGQVTTGSLSPTKRMIWLPGELGSSFSGHWVEEGSGRSVAGISAYHLRIETIRKMQDHGDR
jgi:hypothetical protein